jgi:hypothetical protein
MSFPSSAATTNRRLVLICARLLVQCVMGCSIPQAGIDELKFLHPPFRASSTSIAWTERGLIAPGFNGILHSLRQTRQRRLAS